MTVYQYALNSPLIFNDPLGDKAAGGVTGQYADFWNTALSYTRSYGASGFSAFGSDLEGFTRGAATMSENGTWGMNGWAQDYASASQAFYDNTGARALTADKDGYISTGFYYRDGQGKAVTKNGVSGEYTTVYIGKQEHSARAAGSFTDELGQVLNLGGIVWGGTELALQTIRQNNGPQAIGRFLGFGTQRTAGALKGTLGYGVIELGSWLYNGKSIEQNIFDK